MAETMLSEIHDPSERVRALCQYGCNVDIDTNIPPRRYFRSGLEIVRMATVYHEEGDLEKAFVLYSKFLTLFVEKLPKHPEYKTVTTQEKSVNSKKLMKVMPIAEIIKKKLHARYTVEEQEWKEAEKKRIEELAKELERQRLEEADRKYAEELQNEEQHKLNEMKSAQVLHDQEEQLRHLQEQERIKLEQDKHKYDEMAAGVAVAGTVLPGGTDAASIPGADAKVLPGAVPVYPGLVDGSVPGVPPPAYSSLTPGPNVPSRDLKPTTPTLPTAPPMTGPQSPSVPSVDRSSKPDHFTSTGGSTGNKYGLRSVIVPTDIMVKFLNLALPNTVNKTETGGILCGKLSKDSFRITHLLVPKQKGTPDSFETSGEEEVFMYQDEHDLVTLGWIHTHPTQTAFLSSVDLHNHFYYQQMLPEAIAIVCSPKFKETGFFMLTPDYGLNFISNCKERGFHPHPKEPPLFEDCPHVVLDNSASVTVTDLRSR